MTKLYTFLICFCLCTSVWGQSKLSLHTQKILSEGQYAVDNARILSASTAMCQVNGKQYIQAFIYLTPDATPDVLQAYGVKIGISLPPLLTARIPVDRIADIAGLEEVAYIEAATPVHPMLDKARAASLVDDIHNGSGLSQPFRGKGIVVGIIDSGFEYGHPNFYSTDKSELRIKRVWDQSKEGRSPENFDYGVEYTTQEDILVARNDNNYTHGTHVVGIASGADKLEDNDYYGVASDADIVLVSIGEEAGENSVNVSNGIAYIYNYAASVGKPCVVNISIGNHIGPHDGTSVFDQLTDALQGSGKLLVGAAGNSGRSALHLSQKFKSGRDELLKSFIKFMNTPTATYHATSTIDVWGEQGMDFLIQAYVFDKTSSEIVEAFSEFDTSIEGGSRETRSISVGGTGEIFLSTEVNPLNEKPHALLTVDLWDLNPNYYIGLTVTPLSVGTIHAWADGVHSAFTSNDVKGWSTGESKYSTNEIGGTGKKIITAGAYVSRDSYTALGASSPATTGEQLNRLASFSGKGPTADERVKPDITAPGSYIVSSLSNYASSLVLAKKVLWNKKNYNYGYQQGTSMAAPFVTGVLATWLQANPKLRPDDVRSIFKETAIRDDATGSISETGSNSWGYGKIDAWAGIKKCIELASSLGQLPESFPGITVIPGSGGQFRILFSEVYDGLTIAVYDLSGRSVYCRTGIAAQAGDELLVKPNPVSKGIYLIRISNGRTWITEKLVV